MYHTLSVQGCDSRCTFRNATSPLSFNDRPNSSSGDRFPFQNRVLIGYRLVMRETRDGADFQNVLILKDDPCLSD